MLDFNALDSAEGKAARAAGLKDLQGPEKAAKAPWGPQPFRLLTWNTLAPVYFREEPRGYGLEADQPAAYTARHTRICTAIAESGADIICLQEHWFERSLVQLYEQHLGALGYRYEALRRTAWNCDGRTEDGIAVLVREQAFKIAGRHDVRFQDYGIPQDRVALLLTLSCHTAKGSNGDAPQLAVLCTHLTYPHSRYDVEARNAQMSACLRAIEKQVPRGLPVLVAGDLNGPSSDSVAERLRVAGFRSTWDVLHAKPCGITHTDHRGNSFASDHVWVRGEALTPQQAVLLPEETPDSAALQRPMVRAASAGTGAPKSFEEWCQLSDHRPLLASLAWAGA